MTEKCMLITGEMLFFHLNHLLLTGFPQVIGCVDGTQIRISTPKANESDYVNRKDFNSLNVQVLIKTCIYMYI